MSGQTAGYVDAGPVIAGTLRELAYPAQAGCRSARSDLQRSRHDPRTLGCFDVLPDDAGREAHLNGLIARPRRP